MYCVGGSYIFTLQMMFNSNVKDNNYDLSLGDKTDVGHNTCSYAAFHKAVYRHPSKKMDGFNVILFQIYRV